MIGYNRHSSDLISLDVLYNNEVECGNGDVIQVIEESFPTRKKRQAVMATWVEYSAIQCFKKYVAPADLFDASNKEVRMQYPDFADEVYPVNLVGLTCIFGNGFTGYL